MYRRLRVPRIPNPLFCLEPLPPCSSNLLFQRYSRAIPPFHPLYCCLYSYLLYSLYFTVSSSLMKFTKPAWVVHKGRHASLTSNSCNYLTFMLRLFQSRSGEASLNVLLSCSPGWIANSHRGTGREGSHLEYKTHLELGLRTVWTTTKVTMYTHDAYGSSVDGQVGAFWTMAR